MMDWKPVCRGAVGIEFHCWAGIGVGRDLFHRYARLGVMTVYASAYRLDRVLAMWNAARDVLRGTDAK